MEVLLPFSSFYSSSGATFFNRDCMIGNLLGLEKNYSRCFKFFSLESPFNYFSDFGQVISPESFDFPPERLTDHRIEKLRHHGMRF